MFNAIKFWFYKREVVLLGILVFLFVLIRLPGTGLPLHQDEYKWPMITNPAYVSDTEIPHPPLSQFIYRIGGELVGFNVNFRFIPLFFGIINLLLLYYFLNINFGKKTAIIGSSLFTLSYFSILASLMVDTDGQIMPFFFLLSLIAYGKIKMRITKNNFFWSILLIIFLIFGFFVKVSFFLVILALIADFLWQKRKDISKRDFITYLMWGITGVGILILLLIVSQYIFSFFDLSKALSYWEHFAKMDRNWFQTFIQVVKVILYISPFILLIPFLGRKEDFKKVMSSVFYILFGMIFYIILFDFSIGALDRYLQFLIIPLCVIGAVIIDGILKDKDNFKNKEYFLFGSILAILLLLTLFIPHFVPSLHPKSAWLSRIINLKWNFLYPFSGGSGPLGFYVSFLFMALAWLISTILLIIGIVKPQLRKMVLIVLLPIGIVYNAVFAEEYLFGRINGSAPKLLNEVVEFIKNNPDIKYVTVYNDNGGAEIQAIGKYRKRLYTDPAFDINEKIATLNKYKEHYLEIDVPKIDPQSVYRKYLDSCEIIYYKQSRSISSKVYDCTRSPELKM